MLKKYSNLNLINSLFVQKCIKKHSSVNSFTRDQKHSQLHPLLAPCFATSFVPTCALHDTHSTKSSELCSNVRSTKCSEFIQKMFPSTKSSEMFSTALFPKPYSLSRGLHSNGSGYQPLLVSSSCIVHQRTFFCTASDKPNDSKDPVILRAEEDAAVSSLADEENNGEENSTSVEENSTSVEENSTSVEENSTSVEENSTSVEENSTSVEENSNNVEENSTSVEENSNNVEENSTSTVGEALIKWSDELERAGVPEPQLSAQHIVAHVLDTHRVSLL